MRWTKFLIPTLKETPQEALIKSHRLMIRAGIIRKLASGTYTYLPLGLRALHKAEKIIREEMEAAGAQELLMPALHPAEIWKESGRFEVLGDDMIHFKDRHGRENVLGPTHEEIITDLARRELRSYKSLPVTLYQIQTKFRDEMRPRSGVIRSREFLMKDAYSFHATPDSLDETYNSMKDAYSRIFGRCGLDFHIVQADPGAMGGSGSQEFVLFSDAGEDRMVQAGEKGSVVSVEMAERQLKGLALPAGKASKKFTKVATPGHSNVEGVAAFLKKKPSDLVKTMIYETSEAGQAAQTIAVLVRGDHEVSDYKLKKIHKGAALASRQTIEALGSAFGYSGPFGMKGIPFYIDEDILEMKDFVTGANETGQHLTGVEISDILNDDGKRKLVVGDFRQVVEGDVSKEKAQPFQFKTAIELGHIFKLNQRYSVPLKANFLDSEGTEKPVIMGCYGIGVNRILAAAIEQLADDKGIVWPRAISPFQVEILLVDAKDPESNRIADTLARELAPMGVDALIDDRPDSAGVKFNDADLIGLPLRVILGPKSLKQGKAEIKIRRTGEMTSVDLPGLSVEVLKCLDKLGPR